MVTRSTSKWLATISLLSASLCAVPAYATSYPAMQLSDSSGNLITVDSSGAVTLGGSCTASTCVTTSTSGPGNVNWSGTIGSMTFTATGTYLLTPLPYLDINISSLTTTAATTLTASLTETAVAGAPVYSINLTNTSTGVNSATYQAFADPSNAPFSTTGTAVLIGSLAGTGMLNNLSGPSGPAISVTDKVVVNLQSGASYSTDFYALVSPYVASACAAVNAVQNQAAAPAQLTAKGGVGPYSWSAAGLPSGLQLSTDGILSGTPTQSGTFPYTITITDEGDSNNVTTEHCTLTVQPPSKPPSFTLKKSASPTTVAPYQLVTYTYVVTNTGGTTLNNIKVVDDNATPNDPNDDYTVGTVASLAPGQSATLTWQTYPTLHTVSIDQKAGVIPSGTLAIQSIPGNGCTPNVNCPLRFIFNQSENLNDNTYGSNAASTWGSQGHQFSDLAGSDQAQWEFYDSKGNTVLQVGQDYLSNSSGPSSYCSNPNWGSYPSGWGSQGWCGGTGSVITGNPSCLISGTTSLTDNLNKSQFNWGYTNNSPSQGTQGWTTTCGYTISINPKAFGSNGFGGCSIPWVHNTHSKNGTDDLGCTPTSSTATNTATATDSTGIKVSATATVTISSNIPPSSPKGYNPGGKCTIPLSVKFPGGCSGAAVGKAFDVTLETSGGKSPYKFAVTGGQLPPGLNLDAATGSITGTPTKAGNYQVTITVTDAESPAQSAAVTGTITVASPGQQTGASSGKVHLAVPPCNGQVLQQFSAQLSATGGSGKYTYSVAGGSLPWGLSLDPNSGVISGYALQYLSSGQVSFQVKDSNGNTDTETGSFNIGW